MASKRKDGEAAALEAVLNYLCKNNRPYSAMDVFNNLQKDHGKTAVTRALEVLAAEGKIVEKTYGKQKVYAPKQEDVDCADDNQLQAMDLECESLSSQVKQLQEEQKQQETTMASLGNQLTTEEARKKLHAVKNENEKLLERLEKIREAPNAVSEEDRKKAHSEFSKMYTLYQKRKRLANDIISCLMESYPKSKKELLEQVGVETDEDVGFKLLFAP